MEDGKRLLISVKKGNVLLATNRKSSRNVLSSICVSFNCIIPLLSKIIYSLKYRKVDTKSRNKENRRKFECSN